MLGRARLGAKSGGTGKPPVYDSPAPEYSPPSNDSAQTTADSPGQSAPAPPDTQSNPRRREAEDSGARDISGHVSASANAIPDNNRRRRGHGARENDVDDVTRERSEVGSPEAGESSRPENDDVAMADTSNAPAVASIANRIENPIKAVGRRPKLSKTKGAPIVPANKHKFPITENKNGLPAPN